MKKQDVAAKAGVTPTHLRRVLKGEVPLSADLEAGLERALQWPRGRIKNLLPSDAPPDQLASPPPGSRYTQAEWDRLDHADRLMLTDIQRKLDARGNPDAEIHPLERRRTRGA